MGFFSKLFGKATPTASTPTVAPTAQKQVAVMPAASYNPQIPELQGDYAKTVFLWAHQKASTIRKDDEYQRYFLYECGIKSPALYHRELISQGYFSPAPLTDLLSALKVAELKDMLSKRGLPTTGKKADLIERILSSVDEASVKSLYPSELYILSDKGQAFLDEHQNYVLVHTHKTNWGIDWHEFDANYQPGVSFYDVCWGIFNKRILEDRQNFGRNEYLHMYDLLTEEGKRPRALEMLLRVLYIDLSGTCGMNEIDLFRKGIYTKKDLQEGFSVAIMLAPGIIKRIGDFKDIYSDDVVDRLYEQRLPVQICSKKLFLEIVHSVLNETYDEEKTKQTLKKAYYAMINSL